MREKARVKRNERGGMYARVCARQLCVSGEGVRGKKDGSLRRGKAVTTPRL